MRSEVDNELAELWKLIQQHSNKTNTGQKKKGRLDEGMVQVKGMKNYKLR